WKAYNYIWNAEQTDAVLADDVGTEQKVSGIGAWRHASRTECLLCHTTRVGSILGFRPQNLDRQHDYGGIVASQLTTLNHIGLFAEPLSAKRAVWPNPLDKSAPLEA